MKNKQTIKNSNAVNLFLRKMIIIFLVLALIILTYYTAFYVDHDCKPIVYLMYLYILHHVIWLWGIIYFKDLPVEPLIMMYISYILVALYPVACIYWNARNPAVFFWYLIIFFGAIVFNRRHIEVWILLILAIVISVFFCCPLFPKIDNTSLMTDQANIVTVVSTIALTAFLAIVYVKKNNIEESMRIKTLQANTENAENLEKYKALYSEIIKYLEKEQPFENPDFNEDMLAKKLNSNTLYISMAINVAGETNFKTLLRKFRINYVKSMIDNEALKRYTIDYIFTKAGYKSRSTFNNAFKSVIGMTPTDYVASKNNNGNHS